MTEHRESRIIRHRRDRVYPIVAKVEHYPDFLPWCVGTRVRPVKEHEVIADVLIGFRMIRERFTSRVVMVPNETIDTYLVDGPFHHMEGHWRFSDTDDGATLVDFNLSFRFRSRMLEGLIGLLFSEAVAKMVGAFERRAEALYGDPSGTPALRPNP